VNATWSRYLVAVMVLLVLATAACTGTGSRRAGPASDPSTEAGPRGPLFESYAALGDSFTAGPFIPVTALAGGCLRSSGDYPHLLARRLHIQHLRDVSCSGASTRDLAGPQHPYPDSTVPPQLDAVRPGTDLVTLGIGGNDFALFGTLVGTCSRLRAADPRGAPCAHQLAASGRDPSAEVSRIRTRVAAAVRQVRRRAPSATVLLVGYPRLAPAHGTCPVRLPFAHGDYAEIRRVTLALNRALAAAARDAGAVFVDVYAASRGHDVCSAEPWVNGAHTDRAAALAYHPFAHGMVAVARLVSEALPRH
jgi:lysophospholipase L1-like esterase